VNIERALLTDGWMSERELTYLASISGKSLFIAEIGSWRGRSARAMADNTKGVIHCFDTWADNAYGAVFPNDAPDLCQHTDWLWKEFNKNHEDTIGENVFPHRMNSLEGASYAQVHGFKFDVIFIDAGHNYEDVVSDIRAWRPLLKEHGILCGHDYNPIHHTEVIRAVHDLIPEFRIFDTIWTTEIRH